MMKLKGQTEYDEGMFEYLEDIIGCGRLNEFIKVLCRRVEILNEYRGEKVNFLQIFVVNQNILMINKFYLVKYLL